MSKEALYFRPILRISLNPFLLPFIGLRLAGLKARGYELQARVKGLGLG